MKSPRWDFTLAWSPNSCDRRQVDLFRLSGTGNQWGYTLGPQDYVFADLKGCCLRVWIPVSLKLGTEIISLETLTALAHSQLLGVINLKSYLDNHKGLRDNQKLGQIEQKVHLLYKSTPSRMGEVAVLFNAQKPTQKVS